MRRGAAEIKTSRGHAIPVTIFALCVIYMFLCCEIDLFLN